MAVVIALPVLRPTSRANHFSAAFVLSVPPLVKTVSSGDAPISAATCARAASTALRAALPGA